MTRVSARIVVLVALLVALMALPATAQSRWDFDAPIVMGLAEGGFLFTIAPPTFMGCSDGFTAVELPGLPHLDLWSGFLVNDPGAPVLNMRWVFTPLGTLNIKWQSDVWIRVFPLAEGDLDDYLANPCGFYGSHAYVAEGPGRMNYTSADDSLSGPGVNSWGWTIHGDLNNNGYCPAGQDPRLFWLQKWVVRSQTDIFTAKSTASKGPALTCK